VTADTTKTARSKSAQSHPAPAPSAKPSARKAAPAPAAEEAETSTRSDTPVDEAGLLADPGVNRALDILTRASGLLRPSKTELQAACWKAAALKKTARAQRWSCLYEAAQLLGAESRYMLKADAAATIKGPDGFVGIGVSLLKDGDNLVVTDVLPDGPAARAGVRTDDRLLQADGEPLAAGTLLQAVGRLRGSPGSTVRVQLASAEGSPRSVDIQRANMAWPTEFARPVPGGWYLQLRSITNGADDRLRMLMLEAHRRHELQGVFVLDLRGNSGGLAEDVVDVAQALTHQEDPAMVLLSMTRIGRNAIRTTGGNLRLNESARGERYEAAQAALQAMPMVVLTDERVASGSLWLTATLRERRNTYVVGQPTSKSAVVLNQIDAGDGEGVFRLPTDHVYAVGSTGLHNEGITPDLIQPVAPILSNEAPPWLQTVLQEHAARWRQPRLLPHTAPGGATPSTAQRQCIGPVSFEAGAAPKWKVMEAGDPPITLGTFSLYVVTGRSQADHAAVLERTQQAQRASHTQLAENIRNWIGEASRRPAEPLPDTGDDGKPLNAAQKVQLEAQARTRHDSELKEAADLLTRLAEAPMRPVPGHPGAALLTSFDGMTRGSTQLWWWHDGVSYMISHDELDGAPLTAWLERFVPGVPALNDRVPALCLPNATLLLPSQISPLEGMLSFTLADTGASVWKLGFSQPSGVPHDGALTRWLLQGDYDVYDATALSRSSAHAMQQHAPQPLRIGGRDGVSLHSEGPDIHLTRVRLLPVLGTPDPWQLGIALIQPHEGQLQRDELDRWQRLLGGMRWGARPSADDSEPGH
jgi:carboxyl-terminal processing protease